MVVCSWNPNILKLEMGELSPLDQPEFPYVAFFEYPLPAPKADPNMI